MPNYNINKLYLSLESEVLEDKEIIATIYEKINKKISKIYKNIKNTDDIITKIIQKDIFPFAYINNSELFNQMIKDLKTQYIIGIDTEFSNKADSITTIDTIQISTLQRTYIIDTYEVYNLIFDLKIIFENNFILKVLHSPKTDFILLFNQFKLVIKNFIDVQKMFDCNASHGFDTIVKSVLNINIDKAMQKSTWWYRPLSNDQLFYATMDAFLLLPIYYKLFVKKIYEKQGPELSLRVLNHFQAYYSKPQNYSIIENATFTTSNLY